MKKSTHGFGGTPSCTSHLHRAYANPPQYTWSHQIVLEFGSQPAHSKDVGGFERQRERLLICPWPQINWLGN